jgi:hypothetical protein
MATFSSTRMSADKVTTTPTHQMQGEAISLDNEKQATFKISGPGEPLQITMKCNAASARPQRLQTARARDD